MYDPTKEHTFTQIRESKWKRGLKTETKLHRETALCIFWQCHIHALIFNIYDFSFRKIICPFYIWVFCLFCVSSPCVNVQ